jgi:hypothetical protein
MRTISLNTFVDFVADFPEPGASDDLPGKEVAEFLASGLQCRGIEAIRIADERPDIGRYVYCSFRDQHFAICVTFDNRERDGRWQLLPYPADDRGRIDRRKRRNHSEAFETLLLAIHETLRQSPQVREVRWFPHFREPHYLAIQRPGDGPIRDPRAEQHWPFVLRLDRFLNDVSRLLVSPLVCLLVFVAATALAAIDFSWALVLVAVWLTAAALSGIVLRALVSLYVAHAARQRNS